MNDNADMEKKNVFSVETMNLSSVLASVFILFFFSSRRRHTRSLRDWSSDVCSSDLGPHDPAVQVRLDRQPEAVEPFGVRGIAAESRVPAIRPGPGIGAADPGGVLDRQRAGVDLLAVIDRNACGQVGAELPGRAPQPADAPVGLALVRQDRE